MTVVRTFVAVLIGDELRTRVSGVQEPLKKLAPDVKWVAPDNLHVTIKFLGNVREDDLPGVYRAVEEASGAVSQFDLSLSGLGAFPNARRARVVWVGIEEGREQLVKLASAVDSKLARLGFPKEEREFKSHITIGRVKEPSRKDSWRDGPSLERLASGINEIDASDLGSQRVSSVAVMRSELRPGGPVYSPLKEIALIGG
jgi:RNA 2',3'-cyclic 3'-phosphodiesterase